MQGRLTDSEWERITEFARTPMHERTPEQLVPEDTDVGNAPGEDE
ncbi:hypothetical protein SAMN05216388_101941 [Halorientalis persicus]|jgi:hypothetical protein|uniref:Uncharacterized protein n=1 Tax=Halorientalis persicus TaxID=1367881 RepID=A0A1H8SI93_9EURY|nr:hypothetical protein [Halorientalis persicus]SEO78287.1 hypothetical protein SAMN05216388_101941 [Halorientalis persicus]